MDGPGTAHAIQNFIENPPSHPPIEVIHLIKMKECSVNIKRNKSLGYKNITVNVDR